MPSVDVEEPIELAPGERATYRIDPVPHPSCRVIIALQLDGETDWRVMSGADASGNPVPSPSDVGNFHQDGHALGRLSLRASNGRARGKLRMTVICEQPHGPYTISDDRSPILQPAGNAPFSWWNVFRRALRELGEWIWTGVRFVLLPVTLSWLVWWHFWCWLARVLADMDFDLFWGVNVEDPPPGGEFRLRVAWFCNWVIDLVEPVLPDSLKPLARPHEH